MERLEARLDKMETSIHKRFDELSRLDERHAETVRRVSSMDKRLGSHSERLLDLELETKANSKTTSHVERLFWVGVSAVAAVLTYLFKDLL